MFKQDYTHYLFYFVNISRYGFRFEEKYDNGIVYGYNPSELGNDVYKTPVFLSQNGATRVDGDFLFSAGISSVLWGNSAGMHDWGALDLTTKGDTLRPVTYDWRFFGFSLRYGRFWREKPCIRWST